MGEVMVFTVPGRYLAVDKKNPGAQDVVLASDYAALEAEVSRLLTMQPDNFKFGYNFARNANDAKHCARLEAELAASNARLHEVATLCATVEAELAELREGQQEAVAAQQRFRRPEKGTPDWSEWQQCAVRDGRPSWEIDSQGWEVEYRLLYLHPAKVVMPDYKNPQGSYGLAHTYNEGWNACIDELERLNGGKQ